MSKAREFETKHVRAWNLKPGDVVEFFDSSRAKVVRRTVAKVSSAEDEGGPAKFVVVRFRRFGRWGLLQARNNLVRVRRLR